MIKSLISYLKWARQKWLRTELWNFANFWGLLRVKMAIGIIFYKENLRNNWELIWPMHGLTFDIITLSLLLNFFNIYAMNYKTAWAFRGREECALCSFIWTIIWIFSPHFFFWEKLCKLTQLERAKENSLEKRNFLFPENTTIK